MPFTFFAHQAPVLPLKIWRPRWFDGTALCVGAMAPDFAYPLWPELSRQSHTAIGIATWSVGATLVICWAIRTWVAPTAFAQLPDLWWFRVHSYRVLAKRRPPLWQTVTSALVGAATHVIIDGFTHPGRWGAEWAGFGHRAAKALQYTGHSLGSLIAIAFLAYIGRRRLLDRWYGAATVERVRRFTLAFRQRVAFWCIVGTGVPIGWLWAAETTGVKPFRLIDSVAISTALACLLPLTRPVESPGAELQVG